ncbi:pikachurin-like [Tigriopus californicus]|uniref:pikachurin-like n=1 Tax=Tigriopus californicus TaxID=6832 RepID=UPI0027DA23AC|nr:pikachurin-like [Tigriopus californicus]
MRGGTVIFGTLAILAALLPVMRSNFIPLEAAFQGRCENGHPCDQTCFNIHNEMFECSCTEGYALHFNGYSCLMLNDTTVAEPEAKAADVRSILKTDEASSPNLAIQIEVDIDPPPHQPNDPSDAELEKLGLPTHHVHYSTGTAEAHGSRQLSSLPQGSQSPIRPSKLDDDEDPSHSFIEPPRVLPSISGARNPPNLTRPKSKLLPPPTKADQGDVEEYKDKVYEIDAFCNLECGVEGECFMTRNEKNIIKKRCLCPHGKYGEKCALDRYISSPRFSGHSYLALPTLTNAYSDLQLSMEFRPASGEGILLLTGESADMTGDYLALIIRDGHIELRLDCGTGPGIVRTRDQVHLHQWNRLTIFRHDWGVWLQLNEGVHEEGRSQGLFSRITFAQPVLLGGTGSFRNTGHFLDTNLGFRGCIRRLEINNKIYNFEPSERQGDTLFGMDTDECPEDSCSSIPCQNNGVCVSADSGSDENLDLVGAFEVGVSGILAAMTQQDQEYDDFNQPLLGVCQCPLGFSGEYCEKPVEVKIPSFNGTSHLTYFGLADSSPLWNDFEVVLRSEAEDGLILYNGNNNDGSGDFLALFLSRGFVEFAFDNGDGVALVRSEYPITLHQWHTIRVSRTGRLAFLSVDGQNVQSQMSPGAFNELTANQNMYLGGVPTFRLVSPYIPIRKGLKGCIQKLSINHTPRDLLRGAIAGTNVDPCSHPCSPPPNQQSPCGIHGTCRPNLEDFSCECPLGWVGINCAKKMDLTGITALIPRFRGNSFLHLNREELAKNVLGNTNSINIRLKVTSANGLILWTGGDTFTPASDYLMLGILDGYLHYRFNLGNGEGVLIFNETRINDGRWHRIRATRAEQTASLNVDNGHVITGASPGKLRQLNGNGQVYIGGMEDLEHLPLSEFRHGLMGCIADITIGRLFDIKMMEDSSDGRNVENCLEEF